MNRPTTIRRPNSAENGFLLIAAMFLLFVFALSLSIAAPLIAKSIQHDREVETMERGKQYQRAIQLYFRKFGSYPPSLDALVKTNNIRFLRKKYIDPMTGKSDWKPILFGQNKAPMAMGFFGEPLAGGATQLAGIGPSGGGAAQSRGQMMGGGSPSPGGVGSTSIFAGSSFGSSPTTSGTDTAANSTMGVSGTATSPTGQTGTSGTPAGSGSNSGTGTGSSSAANTGILGNSGSQSFGGAGVVGVSAPVEKQSILFYKKKQKYSEWEFTYSPISDQMKQNGGNAATIGQPASSLGRPLGSTPATAAPSANAPSSTGNGTGTTPQPQP
jgi:type II secretory pathway pseudopilin PulG